MLTDLEITDLGIIEHVALALEPGLNVVTGETGAGKTMVVSGLQWLLGGRSDRDKVRAGARVAVVQARFEGVPQSAVDWADPEDDELLISREVGARGDDTSGPARSRARIAGRLAPVTALAEVLDGVVEIHSQHESIRLSDPKVQRHLLDRFGASAVADARVIYDQAYSAWRQATAAMDHAETALREGTREADRLRFEADEIDAVDPAEGEEETLDADIARLDHAESLRLAATQASEALMGESAARDALGIAVQALRGVVQHDAQLAELLARVEAQLAEVQEAAIDLVAYLEGLEADPAALERAAGRRAAIGNLLRKYGPTTADVRRYRDDAREKLALFDGGEERLAELRAAEAAALAEVAAAGAALRAARQAAGQTLAAAVDGHLDELAMRGAATTVVVDEAPPGPHGADRIEILLAANPGEPPLPLGRAASGGERSRVALAVRVALADADETPVLVFDEVDAGIGGETALAVGRKLARLALGRQVLCVTHLAQLAAFADAHFVVHKHVDGVRTVTDVVRLTEEQRGAELSRMLSGTPESETAQRHAAELLQLARTPSS